MKPYQVFFWFLLFRILSIFLIKTWYVPDEYWQSLEVGHKLAFGYVIVYFIIIIIPYIINFSINENIPNLKNKKKKKRKKIKFLG